MKLLLSSGDNNDIDIKKAVRQIEARKKIKTKLIKWYHIPAIEYPTNLSLEQCSSEQTAKYKQRFIHKGDICADLCGGLGVDTYYISQIASEVDYFEQNKTIACCSLQNFKLLSTDSKLEHYKSTNYNFTDSKLEHYKSTNYNSTDSKLEVHNSPVYNSNINPCNIHVYNQTVNKEFLINSLANPYLSGPSLRNHYDLFYLDPARRSKTGSRIYSIEDSSPNICELKEWLFKKSPKILLKISPMADLTATLKLLPETSEVHIISLNNECKELLLLLERDFIKSTSTEPIITCVNLKKNKSPQTFKFKISNEKNAKCTFAKPEKLTNSKPSTINNIHTHNNSTDNSMDNNIESESPKYLYEPNKSITKAGAFKYISEYYKIDKIATGTHLYLSNQLITFPGKTFKILQITDMSKKSIIKAANQYPNAAVSAKNIPLSSNELKKKLKVGESETYHIFGLSRFDGKKRLYLTKEI
ncbi:MAG: hypothetical protein WC140_04420 [Bacteroidales bacterium]